MKIILIIIFGLLFLILWLVIGYPIEISWLSLDRFVACVISVLIAFLIWTLYRKIKLLKNKIFRLLLITLLICISAIYLWIGTWTVLINHSTVPIWVDTQIYTNQNGDKVISEFRETSGSIYDYRDRLILYEFNDYDRFSIEWTKKRMHGLWKVVDYSKDFVYFENFNNIKK